MDRYQCWKLVYSDSLSSFSTKLSKNNMGGITGGVGHPNDAPHCTPLQIILLPNIFNKNQHIYLQSMFRLSFYTNTYSFNMKYTHPHPATSQPPPHLMPPPQPQSPSTHPPPSPPPTPTHLTTPHPHTPNTSPPHPLPIT